MSLKELVELPGDWRVRIDAADVSDAGYFQDFGQGPESTSVDFVERFAGLSYRDENWRLAAQVQNYRTIDLTNLSNTPGDDERPDARLPQFLASGDFAWGPARVLRYGFDSELVNFTREYGVTGWRFDLMPHAGLNFEGAGYFVRESVAWRYTQYELDDTLPAEARSPSRTLPIESLDAGLLFERSGNSGRTLTLEPRMQYLYVPYRNQNDLPVFDTALPDLNLVELFRTNRYVGADRQSDSNQVNIGVTSRLLDTTSGQQFLAATLGETYFLSQPRVSLPGEAVADPAREDVVAELALTAYKHWNINLGEQYNVAAARTDRTFVELQFKPAPESVINIAYRFQRNVQDEALGIPGCALNQPTLNCPPPADLLKQAEISVPGRSPATGMSSGAWCMRSTAIRPWSASRDSSTTPAAGGCGCSGVDSCATTPDSRRRASCSSWNSRAWQVSDQRLTLSSGRKFGDTPGKHQLLDTNGKISPSYGAGRLLRPRGARALEPRACSNPRARHQGNAARSHRCHRE